MSPIAETAAAWLLAYAVHSTILLGAAALLTWRVVRDPAWRETLWKAALAGALLTVPVQALAGYRPVVGRWALSTSAASPRSAAEAAPPQVHASEMKTATADRKTAAGTASPSRSATPAPGAAPSVAGPGSGTAAVPEPMRVDWRLAALLAWGAVAAVLLARLAWRQWSLHRLLRRRTPVEDAGVLALLDELRRQAGVRTAVRLTQSGRCASPMALGPREVCVPERFVADLAVEEQRGALAHELAHLARRDPLWHLAAGLAEALFFFQPLNQLARRRLRESAEYLCDDWAVRQTGSPLGLARCLVEVAGWVSLSGTPVPEGALAMAEEGGSSLARRVERLVRRAGPPPPSRAGVRVAAAAALLATVALVAPAVTPLAAEPEKAGEAKQEEPRTWAARQEPVVVRHPNSAEPLASRWEWARGQAGAWRAYWVAWAVPAAPIRGNVTVDDTHGLDVSDLEFRPLPDLFGVSYTDAIVLFRFGPDGRVERTTTRIGRVGLAAGATPIYWLGMADAGESLGLLEERERSERDEEVRGSIVAAIGAHAATERVVPPLLRWLARDRSEKVRAAAAGALGRHPRADALEGLLAAAEGDRAEHVRRDAAEAVGEMRLPAARAALGRLLRESRLTEVRAEAAEAMGQQEDAGALGELERAATSDPSQDVRREAAEAMGEQPAARALPVLARLAWRASDVEVQREAVEAMGEFGDRAALAALDSIAAGHPVADVQREAVETIVNFPVEIALPALRRYATRGRSVDVRREAVETLGQLKDPSVLGTLEEIARRDPDVDVQRAAVETIGDAAGAGAVELLSRLAWDPSVADVQREAVETIGSAGGAGAVEALSKIAWEHPVPDVQREAVETLGDVGGAGAAEALSRIVWRHPGVDARREAVETLGDLPDQAGLAALDAIIASHTDEDVLREAVETLTDFPPRVSRPRLERIASTHPRQAIRAVAREELDDLAAN